MKRKTLLLLFITMNSLLFSQISFDNVYSNDWTTSGWQPAIDSDNNYYIPFYHTHEEGDYETWGGILKLNEVGQTIDSMYIEQTLGSNCYQNGPRITIISDTLYCFGNRFSTDIDNYSFHATKLDLDLNVISSVEIPYPAQYELKSPRSIEYYNNKFVMLCNYYDENSNLSPGLNSGIFMMEINRYFTDYNFEFSQDGNFFTHSLDFVKRPTNDYLIATIDGWYNNDENTDGVPFAVFNSDLTPEFTYGVIKESSPYSKIDIDIYQDSLYLYAGNAIYNNASNLSIFKVDQDFNVLDSTIIYTQPGALDTINQACTQCLDQFDDNNIYFASNRHIGIPNWNQNFPNYIRLVKLDGDLNIIWEKFYGGDRANYVNGVMATPDGGCIMLCNYYDIETYPFSYHRSLRVIKVDSDGLITGIPTESRLKIKSLLIYPNPTNGIIQLETSLREYKLHFYSTSGTEVLQTEVLNENQTLDLSALSNGTYHYSVINNKGIRVDSGSVVLEK